VNSVIRGHLDRMARSYRHVLIDCEAGLEHLSRRTAGQPDRLVCVTNRARMGAETVRRALETYRSLHESLPVLDLVLNGFDPGDAQIAETMERAAAPGADFARVFTLPWSDELAAFDTAGRTLLELGQDAPALAALHAWEDCA
jgi:CO dehydrogenase maturation factor